MDTQLSAIPFYKLEVEQDFRRWYAYGSQYQHYVSDSNLIPFFFCLPKVTGRSISSVQFYQVCCVDVEKTGAGDYNLDFSSDFKVFSVDSESYEDAMFSNGLQLLTIGDWDVIAYPALSNSDMELEKGMYYIKITLSDGTIRYSDVFTCCTQGELNMKVKLEWYNQENLEYAYGVVPYQLQTFKNVMYLDTTIGMPEYTFTEEAEERNGYVFPIKQISEKTFHMRFYAPEYVCDAMRVIRLSDRIKITDAFMRWVDGELEEVAYNAYMCDSFNIDVSWLEQGHYADVSCDFQTDTIVKMIGKGYTQIQDR